MFDSKSMTEIVKYFNRQSSWQSNILLFVVLPSINIVVSFTISNPHFFFFCKIKMKLSRMCSKRNISQCFGYLLKGTFLDYVTFYFLKKNDSLKDL